MSAIVALGSIAYAFFIIIKTLIFGVDLPGYASLATMQLFFSGLIMIGMGIMGEYLGRVFMEVKNRPLYLIEKAVGFGPDMDLEAMAHVSGYLAITEHRAKPGSDEDGNPDGPA